MLKLRSIFCWVSLLAGCFYSCDVLEPDADVIQPDIKVSSDQVFAYSTNSTVIDLKSKVRTNQPVRFKVTVPTRSGELTDIGKGLLQYTPAKIARPFADSFEFTIFSESDEILKKDTVFISIEKDSTGLPCGIFPADDYVYGVQKNIPVRIPVLANDYLCSADSSDVVVSVLDGDGDFPPWSGTVEAAGNAVVYSPGGEFQDYDKFIYKVHTRDDPSNAFFGVVYLMGGSDCDFFQLKDDTFSFDPDTLFNVMVMPVLDNDSLCLEPKTWRASQSPLHGDVNPTNSGFTYQVKPSVIVTADFSDSFRYEVCFGNNCKTARVEVKAVAEAACTFYAKADTADLSGNTIPLMYIDVLHNDQTCDGYTTFTITEPANHGTAYVSPELQTIAYERDPFMNKNDSLEYQICNAEKCSRAKVFIKRE